MHIAFVIQDLHILSLGKILQSNVQEYDHEEIYFCY